MNRPHYSPGVMSDCQRAQALRWTGGPPMDWSRVSPWCSNPSAWREGVRERFWRLRLKTATQVQMTWWVGLRLTKIEDWAKTRPRKPAE
ncbi:hypothetical protein U9M48_001064 [Paspalum notatum var. saurae]|uniref:Uncharacterized protein n=1 Tax=Paspalum notatum var. saurae TaxID=547442 RepID=A0AAQ3SCQ6_PASNO